MLGVALDGLAMIEGEADISKVRRALQRCRPPSFTQRNNGPQHAWPVLLLSEVFPWPMIPPSAVPPTAAASMSTRTMRSVLVREVGCQRRGAKGCREGCRSDGGRRGEAARQGGLGHGPPFDAGWSNRAWA
jgi:hypothetical protein